MTASGIDAAALPLPLRSVPLVLLGAGALGSGRLMSPHMLALAFVDGLAVG